MQLKTLTLIAASLAVASANPSGWGDETKAPVLDSTTAPVDKPTGKPQGPDGGKTDVADSTAASSSWSDATWAKTTTTPVAITSTTTSDKPKWTKPVDGGKTDVADTTASSSTEVYWGDEPSKPVEGGKKTTTTTPAASTITSETWADHSIPVTETESTTVEIIVSTITKPDGGKETTTIQSTKTLTKTVYLTPTGGAAPPKETPVSGGQGAPPAGGKPDVPVSGGQGQPPAGGQCGVVTQTVTQTQTVTVPAGGKPTGPPAPPPAATTPSASFEMTWQDQPTGFKTSAAPAPSAPAQGGYMGIVAEWRSKMGLSPLEHDSTLESNAQDTANSSGGQLKHKLNSGSMAQVLAPGSMDEFEKIFVGGWLCEMPNLPGLGSSVCDAMSKGWNYAGQTGHAEILSSDKYSKIGCAVGDGICSCDLA